MLYSLLVGVNDIVAIDYSDDYVAALFVIYGVGSYSLDHKATMFLSDAVENSVTVILHSSI
jgi:hypothetical protein